uniref:DUF5641 domain-containing protein n=1 Tax=Anopheles minimus TaxID=112268 RepID=A0A182WG73_9DIPT
TNVKCHVLPEITHNLPNSTIDVTSWNLPSNIVLADPTFYQPGQIDILMGIELFYNIIEEGLIKLPYHKTMLQKTNLGWIVSGYQEAAIHHNADPFNALHACTIEDQVAKFWELESCQSKQGMSLEETSCEDHFLNTYNRDSTGRFIVRLPTKPNVINKLGDSFLTAEKRLQQLNNRFIRNPDLKKAYKILHNIPKNLHDEKTILQLDDASKPIKTLGLKWDTKQDIFIIDAPQWKETSNITKRSVLSDTSRLFDPLGLVGPVVLLAKLYLQDLWKEQISWDELLSSELQQHGSCLQVNQHASSYTAFVMHPNVLMERTNPIFVSCSSYTKLQQRIAWIRRFLFNIKPATKKKNLTPYLSLQELHEATKCLVRLAQGEVFVAELASLRKFGQVDPNSRLKSLTPYLKDDLLHVGGRLRHADKTSTYLARRTSSYSTNRQTLSSFSVARRTTVADIVNAREILAATSQEFSSSSNSFLHKLFPMPTHYPRTTDGRLTSRTQFLRRLWKRWSSDYLSGLHPKTKWTRQRDNIKIGTMVLVKEDNLPPLKWCLGRVTEVIKGADGNKKNLTPYLSLQELHEATKCLVRLAQGEVFVAELASLRKFGQVDPNSRLKSLTPYLKDDLLHVGGRLRHADVSESRKHPLILPAGHPLTLLIAKHYHHSLLHAGPQLLISSMREKFWPLRARNLARRVIHSCISCFRCRPTTLEQLMGDLPRERVTPTMPFLRTVQLAKQFQNQQWQQAVTKSCSQEGIEFKFIPPRSPNFGGLWEAAVKSFKTHLKPTIGNTILTYEELTTLLTQIEACLNSRPLTPLSSDPNDFEALTPAHFLIHRSLVGLAEPSYETLPTNRLDRFQQTQEFLRRLWKRWSSDYLSGLHPKTKWTRQRDNIKLGTMVLVKEDNLPPLKWCLGRVTEVIKGADGNVRVVLIKTKDGEFKRSISKLCILPINEMTNTDC